MPPNSQMYAGAGVLSSCMSINPMPQMMKTSSYQQKPIQHQPINLNEQSPSKLLNRFSNEAPVEFVPLSNIHQSAVLSSPRPSVRTSPSTSARASPVNLVEGVCAAEATVASKWWASKMRQHDLSQTEVNTFEQALRRGIMRRCEGRWYPSEPLRASGLRSIINDLTIDPLLVEAAAAARIRDIRSRLPQAVVWVNPSAVKVKIEEERFTQVLYSGNTEEKISSKEPQAEAASSDEDL
mmetsp:Transcript_48567/g.101482  ORF Transcript_48567/g.101482 Transcript_48567/m.101482 type:complete len:238 (-) Transcript_48567:200-913(-)